MIRTAETRYGTMKCLDNDFYIGRSLIEYGEYSQQEVEFLESLIGDDDIVVDIGANIGCLTVPLAAKARKVYAFEPQPELYKLLCENAPYVTSACIAIGAGNTLMSLPPLDYDAVNNFGGVGLIPWTHHDTQVNVKPLDYFQIQRCALIKIDVEGVEVAVLIGAEKTIKRCRPIIYCEHDGDKQFRQIIKILHDLDYDLWIHTPHLYNPNNFNKLKEDIFEGIVSQNMVAIPHETSASYHLRTDLGPLAPIPREEAPALYLPPKEKPKAPAIKKTGWAAVCRFGGVGDNLIASSVLPLMKEKYGNIEVITEDPYHVVFENNPYIDKLAVYKKGEGPPADKWQEWFTSRAKEYDVLVNLSHSVESTLALFKSHSSFHWPAEFRRKLCDVNYLERAHDICGVERKFAPGFYPTLEETTQAADTRKKMGNRPVIGWCISGSRLDKVYPYSALVIPRLIKELGAFVMMFGAPGRDFELAKAIEIQVNLTNSSGDGLGLALSPDAENPSWPIRRILTQIHHCDLVIGPDTGPMWAVAMSSIPKIMLLSHASPTNITKYWIKTTSLVANATRVPCSPCHQLHDDISTCVPNKDHTGAACISDIGVDAIVDVATKILRQSE